MSDQYDDELFEGVSGQKRRLLAAVAAADLSEDEGEVFLCALDAPDLAAMAWELGRPPSDVRELLVSAYLKIQKTELIDLWELPEMPGL